MNCKIVKKCDVIKANHAEKGDSKGCPEIGKSAPEYFTNVKMSWRILFKKCVKNITSKLNEDVSIMMPFAAISSHYWGNFNPELTIFII